MLGPHFYWQVYAYEEGKGKNYRREGKGMSRGFSLLDLGRSAKAILNYSSFLQQTFNN
jgi:hypothetical protein